MSVLRSVTLLACLMLATSVLARSDVMFKRSSAPAGWQLQRRAGGATPVKFVFALKQRNLDVLETKFWSVSNPKSIDYRQYMSVTEINNLISPAACDVKIVKDWLVSHGVQQSKIKTLADALEVRTEVAVAERLFETEFYQFIHQSWDKKVVRQFGSYSVPSDVFARLDLITGLTNFPHPNHGAHIVHVKSRSDMADDELSVAPQSVYSLYHLPAQTFGNGSDITSQGVIEFEEQMFFPNDLQSYANLTGIKISPLSDDHIVGDNYGYPGTEGTLDIQLIATVNTEATNWYWIEDVEGSEWMYEFAVHFGEHSTVPQVISISYGWYEGAQCFADPDGCDQLGVDDDGYVARMNTEFQKMGLRGVTVVVSSGDSGAHTRTDEDCTAPTLRVEYPAASPFVTSVGATQVENGVPLQTQPNLCTQFSTQCVASGTEVSVSYDVAKFTSGGGFSEVADQPAYQASFVQAYLNSGVKLPDAIMYNGSRRAHPDVSAVGVNVLIYEWYYIESVGGTSAAAPIWAALIALLNQASIAKSGQPLGFINPLLYQIAAEQPVAFNDITSGDNICTESGCVDGCEGWYATKGWDPVSGLGTPNFPALLDYVRNH